MALTSRGADIRVLITGAAGYIGSLLTERLLNDPIVRQVVATGQNLPTALPTWSTTSKLTVEQGRLEDDEFIARLHRHLPLDAVIHTAFRMRAGYGKQGPIVAATNLNSCQNVFQYCFDHGVGKLLYISSAAAYGAMAGNRISHFFREDEPLREQAYPYGVQKRLVEELLQTMYSKSAPVTRVVVVRPCSVTGPRGQRAPSKAVSLIAFLRRLLPLIPEVSPEWTRQFLHEEDFVQATRVLLSANLKNYEVFNLAPGDYLTASDMARVLNKGIVRVPANLVEFVFGAIWHITRGRVATSPGAINSFRYPINLDGSKVTGTGFTYRYNSADSLLAKDAC